MPNFADWKAAKETFMDILRTQTLELDREFTEERAVAAVSALVNASKELLAVFKPAAPVEAPPAETVPAPAPTIGDTDA